MCARTAGCVTPSEFAALREAAQVDDSEEGG